MRAYWKKLVRDTVEQNVINGYKKQHLNYDQYINRLRFPAIPRIIIYSQTQGVDTFLEQVFPLYKYVTPNPSAETDEIIARSVAEQILGSPGAKFSGYLIKGFPFNANQALLFDKYLNGVNLALHVRAENEPVDESINNLLNYYDQRGTLLRVPFLNNPNADQLEFINREIVSHIKTSE